MGIVGWNDGLRSKIGCEFCQPTNHQKTDSSQLFQTKTYCVNEEYVRYLEACGALPSGETWLRIWRRMMLRGQTYTSLQAVITKSIDYFVQMNNGQIGKIVFYFELGQLPHILLRTYKKTFHWTEVADNAMYEVYECPAVKKKCFIWKDRIYNRGTEQHSEHIRLKHRHDFSVSWVWYECWFYISEVDPKRDLIYICLALICSCCTIFDRCYWTTHQYTQHTTTKTHSENAGTQYSYELVVMCCFAPYQIQLPASLGLEVLVIVSMKRKSTSYVLVDF